MKKTKAILTGALFFFTLCNYHVFAQDSAEPESAAAETSTSQQEAEGVLFEGQININTATVEEFKLLPAINQLEAENIVEYRTANGSFNAVDDLLKVRGIRRLEYLQFKDYLTLEGETTLHRKSATEVLGRFEGTLNINTATAGEFELLPAINRFEADNIMEYRASHGKFNSVDDLLKVEGIRRLEYLRFKDYLTLEGETTLRRK